jgi:hypothetical protein
MKFERVNNTELTIAVLFPKYLLVNKNTKPIAIEINKTLNILELNSLTGIIECQIHKQ